MPMREKPASAGWGCSRRCCAELLVVVLSFAAVSVPLYRGLYLSNKVLVQNNSDKQVESLVLVVKNRKKTFTGLKPGERVSMRFPIIRGDQVVNIELDNGDGEAKKRDGVYVTGGMYFVRIYVSIEKDGSLRSGYRDIL